MAQLADSLEITEALASHVAATNFELLEARTIEHVKQAVLDCIGIAIAAGDAESTEPIIAAVNELDAGGTACAIGIARRYQPQYAALINATLIHTLDFDDTHVGGSLHPGAAVIPVALANGEARRSSGKELLAAVAAGYDVAVRLSEAMTPQAQYSRGFHPTAICGSFGAAAAAANLAQDDPATITSAFGITLSLASGSMQYLENGSWNKRFQVGFAAHNGLIAEGFARAGVLGAARSLEGRFGLAFSYAGTTLEGLSGRLMGRRAIDETAFKPYPSCRYTHAAIDELIELRRTGNFTVSDVESITVALPRVSFALVKDPETAKRSPRTVVDAQFSMFFAAGAALSRGSFCWSDYDTLDDPQITELARKVEIVADPEIEALGQSMAARVTLQADGRVFQSFSRGPKGEPDRPLGWAELIQKFDGLTASKLDAQRRQAIVTVVRNLECVENIGELMKLVSTER